MHGRPRKPLAADPAREKNEQAKIAHLESLLAEVLLNHRNRCYSRQALQQNARLLEINPEVYTAWNFRKLAVKHLMSEQDEAGCKTILEEELQVVERALKRNYKSYGAWYHRKWVIAFGLSPFDREFQLLDKFLAADDRNFHGWDYRRFAVSVKKIPEDEELQYTTKKINENFSNYSAWHNRSALLAKLFKDKLKERRMQQEILNEEYELVIQAFFTEPDDQSGWFYHLWLLDQTVAPSGPGLTGCWPSNGSTVTMSMIENSRSFVWGFKCPIRGYHCLLGQSLYAVLCFSVPVVGVSADTAKFKSTPELECLSGVYWTPLTTGTAEGSRIWAAEIVLPCGVGEGHNTSSFQLEVGGVPGIYSRDGNSFLGPNLIRFTLEKMPDSVPVCYDGYLAESPLSWPSENPALLTKCFSVVGYNGINTELDASSDAGPEWQLNTLKTQIATCRQLLGLEEKSKWARLTLARLLMAYNNLVSSQHDQKYTDEVLQLFKDLIGIDPAHAHYYEDQLSVLLIGKITCDFQKLQECWLEPESSELGRLNGCASNGWLRLHGLSLSKLSSLERLLWVQRLDLSHNMLRSLDGLEALQLLVYLDISNNLISHVTALGPIRSIKGLVALNIANNEIGRHSIDTFRYCLPSVPRFLSENVRTESNEVCVLPQAGLWEVMAVFGGMQLKQLDISGNPLAENDIYRQQLIGALPSLIWLDGVRVS